MTKHIEDAHQEALVTWSKKIKLPVLPWIEQGATVNSYLYAIPNGGKRNQKEAARFKKQGVKAGVSDLHLALPMNGYHGLWIEMKRPIKQGERKPSVSPLQQLWLERMELAGFKVHVCFGWLEAKQVIESYVFNQEEMKCTA